MKAKAYLAVALLSAGCGAASATQTSNARMALPVAKLAAAGVHLSSATSRPRITEGQARAEFGGAALSAAFEHVMDGTQLNRDAWVIALDPTGDNSAAGPPGTSPAAATFSVAIVDGRTGMVLDKVSGS